MGNDTRIDQTTADLIYFNPRFRVGNDMGRILKSLGFEDFNPRSRVGNDGIELVSECHAVISIHVPAWGTT